MMRHPSDCFEAYPTRVNPNGGSAGLLSASNFELKVSPNPFNQQLNISASSCINELILRDAQGKIYTQLVPDNLTFSLETETLASGIYYLELYMANGVKCVKVVK
jgi:hypothetical protein